MAYTITVNGAAHSVDADGDTPLLWVLRDVLQMTGTKFGCGMAMCGACTVHRDGVPVRACVTPLASVGMAQITTIGRHRPGAKCSGRGSRCRCRSAAIASRDRSCRRLR